MFVVCCVCVGYELVMCVLMLSGCYELVMWWLGVGLLCVVSCGFIVG